MNHYAVNFKMYLLTWKDDHNTVVNESSSFKSIRVWFVHEMIEKRVEEIMNQDIIMVLCEWVRLDMDFFSFFSLFFLFLLAEKAFSILTELPNKILYAPSAQILCLILKSSKNILSERTLHVKLSFQLSTFQPRFW